MRNNREWYSAKELVAIAGLPNSPQGVNKKARTQGWKKRERTGVQGGAVEYFVGDMPKDVQNALDFQPEVSKKENINLIPTQLEDKPSKALVSIPFFHAFASAGFGSVNTSVALPDDYIGLSTQWLWQRGLHRNNLVFLLTSGDSMEPTIHNRDMLLIDRSSIQPRDGEIYVIRVGEQLWVKRVQGLINGIRLISDNRDLYEPIDVLFDDSMDIEILGRVVFVGHSFL